MKKLILAFVVFPLLASAQTMSQEDAFNVGASVGNAPSRQSTFNEINSSSGSSVVPDYGAAASESSYWQNGSSSVTNILQSGAGKITECDGQPSSDPRLKNHCEAVQAINKQPSLKPSGLLNRDDPIITTGKAITNNPEEISGIFKNSYAECTEVTESRGREKVEERCDEFSSLDDKFCETGYEVNVDADHLYKCLDSVEVQANASCIVGREIQVDTKYNYQCQRSPNEIKRNTCDKTLSVTCDPYTDGCSAGGIVPETPHGDMTVYFGPWSGGTWSLRFGTFAGDYWCASPAKYTRTMTFTIANKAEITQFLLYHIWFDDWALIKVNGTTVYVGPYGGDQLTIVGAYVYYTQYDSRFAELATDWHKYPNIDLRPYLVNGQNKIEMQVVVYGCGEGALEIYARKRCDRVCNDSWINKCDAYEKRM